MRGTQENRGTPQNGPSHHLKEHLHLKAKERCLEGGNFIGGYQEKQGT